MSPSLKITSILAVWIVAGLFHNFFQAFILFGSLGSYGLILAGTAITITILDI